MSERSRVFVYSDDVVLQAGVAAQFHDVPSAIATDDLDEAQVAVVVVDEIDADTLRVCRSLQGAQRRIVLIAREFADPELVTGIEAGVHGFVRRSDATPDRLRAVVACVVEGKGWLPSDLIGHLMTHVSQMGMAGRGHRAVALPGFTERELHVLRLVSEGYETAEIARLLCYSERTVKSVVHDITTRFHLKNRAEAVAYALRHGVI